LNDIADRDQKEESPEYDKYGGDGMRVNKLPDYHSGTFAAFLRIATEKTGRSGQATTRFNSRFSGKPRGPFAGAPFENFPKPASYSTEEDRSGAAQCFSGSVFRAAPYKSYCVSQRGYG
jgi:hypothetical protein